MTDPKAAAERINGCRHVSVPEEKFGEYRKYANILADYVLSLTADKGAEERARETLPCDAHNCGAAFTWGAARAQHSPSCPAAFRPALAAALSAAEARVRDQYEPNADDVVALKKALSQLGMSSPESMETLGLEWLSQVRRVIGALARKFQDNIAAAADAGEDKLRAVVEAVAHDDLRRDTVYEGNAFEHFRRLNQERVRLRDMALAALEAK